MGRPFLNASKVVLLDTHIWLWFLEGDASLSDSHREFISTHPNEVLVSPISVWELLVFCRKNKLTLLPSPEKYIRDAINAYPFRSASLTEEIAILSESMDFSHSDTADRFIAATAYAYKAKLVTSNDRLRSLSWLSLL